MTIQDTHKNDRLVRLDDNPINMDAREIHAFACIRDENMRLPYLLKYHRDLGVDRFFFIDNLSRDGSVEYLLEQPDCHTFTCAGNFFSSNVEPPVWSNAVRSTFSHGHWCLSLDADELFVYPNCEHLALRAFCDYVEDKGHDAVQALVVDMYSDKPIRDAVYQREQSFIEAFPYFDDEKGEEVALDGGFPPVLTFSKFRQRAFGTGQHKRKRPPCITQVPLVKWKKGIGYKVAQHILNHANLSELQAAILHFKFFPGFISDVEKSISENIGVNEKGLDERQAYVDALSVNPQLSLINSGSQKYQDSATLTRLGWMRTSDEFESHAASEIYRLNQQVNRA
jgi:hypothetical protein